MDLREDMRRIELAQEVVIDAVHGEPFGGERRDLAVDFLARAARVHLRSRADREVFDVFREIAVVRAADERIGEPERTRDLGGGWQKRDDPRGHARLSQRTSGTPRRRFSRRAITNRASERRFR